MDVKEKLEKLIDAPLNADQQIALAQAYALVKISEVLESCLDINIGDPANPRWNDGTTWLRVRTS